MIYTWKCDGCKKIVEVERDFSTYTNPPEECDECGGNVWERLIGTGTNFILKGGGWFKHGY